MPPSRRSGWPFCGLFVFVALATASYYLLVAPLALSPRKLKVVHHSIDRMEIVGMGNKADRVDRVQLVGIGKAAKPMNIEQSPGRLNNTGSATIPVMLPNAANSSAEAGRKRTPENSTEPASLSHPVHKSRAQGASQSSWSGSIAAYLLVGCFLFGSYILVAKCCGRQPEWVLYVIRKRVCLFRERDITGVHVLEWVAMAWSLGCVEAATLMHLGALVPAINCHHRPDGALLCDHAHWLWEHALPSLYFHVTFYYNWYMCIFGTSPEDAYSPEQRQRLLGAAARKDRPAAEDDEHWSAYGEDEAERRALRRCCNGDGDLENGGGGNNGEIEDGRGRRRRRRAGPLGTDGDEDRGHMCRACGRVSTRSDHHCPFLGTCVGAHNHAYFLALLLHMALSMLYGALLILPSALSCTLYPPPGFSPLPPTAPHGTPPPPPTDPSSHPPAPLPSLTREQCLVLVPVSFGVGFLAASLCAFLAGMLFLAALDLTLREFLVIDLLRFRAGPSAVLRRLLRHAEPLPALARVLGPPRQWWTLLLPCRRKAVQVVPLQLPSAEELAGPEGVYWEEDEDGQPVYRPNG